MLNVAVIENEEQIAKTLTELLKRLKQVNQIAVYKTVYQLLENCYLADNTIDIVITPLELKEMDGIALTDFLSTKFKQDIKVILLTNRSNKEIIEDFFAAGGWSILYENPALSTPQKPNYIASITEFNNALNDALNLLIYNKKNIDNYFYMIMSDFIVNFSFEQQHLKSISHRSNNLSLQLSNDLEEIAYLYAATNFTKHQIAQLLSLSLKTIESKLTRLYQQFELKDRAELVRFCIAKAIIKNARGLSGI